MQKTLKKSCFLQLFTKNMQKALMLLMELFSNGNIILRVKKIIILNRGKYYEDEKEPGYELPYIVVVIDEFADLILSTSGKEIEIKAGYKSSTESIFKGIVIKHRITINNYGAPQLELEIKDKAIKMTVGRKNAYFKEKMLKHGGLLFRDFPINSPKDFTKVIRALGTGDFVDYIGGGSPRKKVEDSVYTSTEAPPSIKINLHNEMSFADNYPSHIFF